MSLRILERKGVLFVCTLLAMAGIAQAQVTRTRIATGLSNPVDAAHIPGDPSRLFIAQLGSSGVADIRIIDLNSPSSNKLVGTPFVTIPDVYAVGERGLLGLTFDPDYATNGYFYVNVSTQGGAQDHITQIRRYQVQGDPLTSNIADPNSGTVLIQYEQPEYNHSGGWIGFNPKINPNDPQYLYISSGDGGGERDPYNSGQDITNNLLATMLRIDPHGDDFPTDPNRNYAIPPTNPFVGQTGDDEIWAYGLRNPWRNSFDRKTGDFWIADVGEDSWEEINFQLASSAGGENYGWHTKEGTSCFDDSGDDGPTCSHTGFTDPVYEYAHGLGPFEGQSVTGGYVYRGSVAQFEGLYFFADYLGGNVWTLDPHAKDIGASVINRQNEFGSVFSLVSFGEDADGELYMVKLSSSDVWKVTSSSRLATWHGDDATSGNAGDGSNWQDDNNWSRDGVVDQGLEPSDPVLFAPGSSVSAIDLAGDRTVAAVTFAASYTLNNDTLTVLSGNIIVESGVTATINSDLEAETVHASLRKHGAGTLIANGQNNQIVVFEGVLGGSGTFDHVTVREGAAVAPGTSTGVMNVTNTATFADNTTLEMELAGGGGVAGTDHDQLNVLGDVQLAGTLDLQVVGPYQPALGDSMDLITGANINGRFANVTNVPQAGNLGVAVRYGQSLVDARVSIRGDIDFDDDVDTGDLTNAIIGFNGATGGGNTWADGDFDGDGDTDTGDLTTAIINFTGASADRGGFGPWLWYDRSTGEIWLFPNGEDIISFSLAGGPFNTANTDFSDLPAGLTDNIASQVGWTSFNLFSGVSSGAFNLGAILPTGLTDSQYHAHFATASYGLALSVGGGGGRFYLSPPPIPEPASIAMFAMLIGMLSRRRVVFRH